MYLMTVCLIVITFTEKYYNLNYSIFLQCALLMDLVESYICHNLLLDGPDVRLRVLSDSAQDTFAVGQDVRLATY